MNINQPFKNTAVCLFQSLAFYFSLGNRANRIKTNSHNYLIVTNSAVLFLCPVVSSKTFKKLFYCDWNFVVASAYYHRIFANAIIVKLPKQSFLFENSLFVVQVIDHFIQNQNQNFRDFRFVCSLQGLNRVRIISKFRTRSFPGPPPFFHSARYWSSAKGCWQKLKDFSG